MPPELERRPGEEAAQSNKSAQTDARSVARATLVLQPLLVDARGAAELMNVSERTVRKFDATGIIPRALRLGRRRVWAVETLRAWVALGCPNRGSFEQHERSEVDR